MQFITGSAPRNSRLLPLTIVLAVLSQLILGCGDSQSAGEPAARAALSQSLSEPTCVTLRRGAGSTVSDTHIFSQQPGQTAGSEPELYVGQVGRHTRQGLISFDAASIPLHATVTSADLTLWRQGPSKSSPLIAHAATATWQESSASWSSFASGFAPQIAASVQPGARPGPISLSLTELVSAWVHFPSLNHGLLLEQAEAHSLLASSESPDAGKRPSLRVCYFLPDSSPATSSAPSLLLQVLDEAGQPLSGASVSSGSSALPTDGAGYVVLDNLAPGFFSARVRAVGFAPAVVSLELPAGARASHQLRLQPLGPPQPFVVEEGATLERGSVRVSIPPHSVVDADGYPVSGSVEATLVPLDPSTTPDSALPGPLEGLPSSGLAEPVPLESFLMAEVSLWQDGRPLQLAPGATATLELLLPPSASAQLSPGDTIPAWWLDTEQGLWVEEGTGTVQASSTHPGRLSWVIEVHHFTWWNCDAPVTDRSCVNVLVQYNNGLPAPGVQVGASGISYTGTSRTAYTNASGHACVEIKRGATARVYAGLSEASTTETTVTGTAEASACGGTACTPVTLTIAPPVCIPGEVRDCPYSGPAGTANVGLCRSAHSYCNATGTAWGSCTGEVLPATETCSNTFDEDCDGEANESCGCGAPCYSGPLGTSGTGVCHAGTLQCDMAAAPYCKGQRLPSPEICSTAEDDNCDGVLTCVNPINQISRYGDVSCQSASLLTTAGSSLFVTGSFSGTLDLGNGVALTSSTGNASYVAKFDAGTLAPRWATRFEATWGTSINEPQVDGSGNVLVLGSFSGTLTVGGTTLVDQDGGFDFFVARLDGTSGALLKIFQIGISQGNASIGPVVVDASGTPLIAGLFNGSLTYGGTTINSGPSTYNNYDLFVAKLDDASGWLSHLDGTAYLSYTQKWDATGSLLVIGAFEGQLTLDGTTISNPSGFANNLFEAKIAGPASWITQISSSTGSVWFSFPQWEEGGSFLASGTFSGDLKVGGTTLATGPYAPFIVRLDAASGDPLWLFHPTTTINNSVSLHAPLQDASHNLTIAGGFSGDVTIGNTVLSNPSGQDAFLTKLEVLSGTPLWLSHFASTGWVYLQDPVRTTSGDLLVTGNVYGGDLTLNGTVLASSAAGQSSFVARFDDTSGALLWFSPFASTGAAYTDGIEPIPSGGVLVKGNFDGNLTLGSTTLSSTLGEDRFLTRLDATSGTPLWATLLDSTNGGAYLSMSHWDSSGNLTVMGQFYGSLTIAGTTLSAVSTSDYFVAKFDGASGALLWLKQLAPGSGNSVMYPDRFEWDESGKLLVMGQFTGTLTVGDTTIANVPDVFASAEYFVARFDGATTWLFHFDSSPGSSNPFHYAYVDGPFLDSSGNIHLSGSFYGNLTMGDITLTTTSGSQFLLKLGGSSGTPVWAQQLSSNGEYSLASIKRDASGNTFIAGTLYGTFALEGAPPLTSAGCGDVFLGKIPASL